MRLPWQPNASVAVIVAEFGATVVGVPLSAPVAGLMLTPAGKPLADHAIVPCPPVWLNCTPETAVLYFSVTDGSLTVISGHDTVSVKFCTAFGGLPLLAVNVSG